MVPPQEPSGETTLPGAEGDGAAEEALVDDAGLAVDEAGLTVEVAAFAELEPPLEPQLPKADWQPVPQ